MNHSLEQTIRHIRGTHGLEATKGDATSVYYELDGQALFRISLCKANNEPECVDLLWLTDKVDTTRPETERIWYYHLGEFNNAADNQIKRICSNSPQWHRQQAQWHEGEAMHHSELAIKHSKRAIFWAKVALAGAILAILSNLLRFFAG